MAPILAIRKQFACNESRNIELSCIGSGELPVDDFSLWIHTFNGHFIRNLTGTRKANISTIVVSCSYENEGDYLCQAWTSVQGNRQLNNVSIKVVIQGWYIYFNGKRKKIGVLKHCTNEQMYLY